MGWLWSDASPENPAKDESPVGSSQSRETNNVSSPQSLSGTSEKPLSPADRDAADFSRIFEEFQSRPPAANQTSSRTTRIVANEEVEDDTSTAWEHSSLHPKTMSCTSAFDQAIYCQLLGGQFINYYRHGTMRDCGELWSNFWFCTRTNRGFMSEEEREGRIQAFYRAREARLRREGSSEDIWEARKEDEIPAWAEKQFKWDLRKWEKGEAVLRDQT